MSMNSARVTLHIEAETAKEVIAAAAALCQGHANQLPAASVKAAREIDRLIENSAHEK